VTPRDEPFLYLTTIGRHSGLPREIEIWFTERAGRYCVISGGRDRAPWVENLLTNTRVSFRVGGRTFQGRARVVDEKDEAELHAAVEALSRKKYGRGEGLIVELAPD